MDRCSAPCEPIPDRLESLGGAVGTDDAVQYAGPAERDLVCPPDGRHAGDVVEIHTGCVPVPVERADPTVSEHALEWRIESCCPRAEMMAFEAIRRVGGT